MTEEVKPAAEASKPEDVKVEKQTIGEINGEKKEVKEDRTVPEAAFLELKNANKELRRDLKDLKRLIEDGGSKEDVSSDIDAIAEEHNIDPKFLKKLATTIRKDAERDIDEKVASKIKPFEERERLGEIDKVFKKHFAAALEEMPEFAGIVNEDVIKSLSFNPANANKTFAQLIEETYGKALPGKRTLEGTKPGGGRAPEGIDFTKARKDSKYFDHIMSDPALKKEYNEALLERIADSL